MKKCKGINKAKMFSGCGDETLYRKSGLCGTCFIQWIRTTDEGKEYAARVAIKQVKEYRKEKFKQKKENKIKILSADAYRKKYVQPKINSIIRRIDYGQPCIATGSFNGKMNAGHYFSTGSTRTLTYHPHNIFLQSEHSNSYRGGDDKRYRKGLIDTFGMEYLDFIESLTQHAPIKLSKAVLIDLNAKLAEYAKTVDEVLRTPEQRISERNRMNEYLSIYDVKYSFF